MCCHFCGKPVSPWYKGMPKGGQTGSLSRQGGGGGNKPKIQSCPHCKVMSIFSSKNDGKMKPFLLFVILFQLARAFLQY